MTTTRPPLGELRPGQPVMVRRSANDMRDRPAEDRYIPAEVVKVGRVWAEIGKPGVAEWSVYRWRMRMDVQNEATQFSGSDASFLTMEQHAWEETRAWARGVLAEHGIWIDRDSRWDGREAELADLLTKSQTAESTSFTVHHLDGTKTVTTEEDKAL